MVDHSGPPRSVRRRSVTKKEDARADRAGNRVETGSAQNCSRRAQNQGLELVGSATNFGEFVDGTYRPIVMPLMAKTTHERSRGVIANYLVPEFGKISL